MRILATITAAAILAAVPASADAKTHGDLVSSQALTNGAAMPAAGQNRLVTYLTEGLTGEPVPVTGVVALPKGKPPRGGWPIFSWAHGTTGIADVCAPSGVAVPVGSPTDLTAANAYNATFMNGVLKAGFAVVRTDYEGVGGPGEHPYLNGTSEGRSVLDIARAARKLSKKVGKRLVISGHSQGGHAALWAAALAPAWTPELKLAGTVAFAPASHIGDLLPLMSALPITEVSGLGALILRGAEIAEPSLQIESLLTDRARALWPETLTKCIGDLSAPASWGSVPANEIARVDADIGPIVDYLNRNDPATLKIRRPVLVLQGLNDLVVMPMYTVPLIDKLRGRGAKVTYRSYAGVDHTGVATAAKPVRDALRFVRKLR